MTCLMKKQKLSISDHHVAIFFCCVWKHSVGTFFSYSILCRNKVSPSFFSFLCWALSQSFRLKEH
jgi:hypothetical protein